MKCNIIIILLLICNTINVNGQAMIMQDNGSALMMKQYVDIKGSPFLYDDWMEGEITFQDMNKSGLVKVKYDQIEDAVYVLSDRNNAYNTKAVIREFKFDSKMNSVYRNGFPSIGNGTNKNFYEVLYDGPVKFLKRVVKSIDDKLVYGSADINKVITSKSSYYLYSEDINQLKEVKRTKSSILQALNLNEAEFNSIRKNKKVDFKSDDDIIWLLASLQK